MNEPDITYLAGDGEGLVSWRSFTEAIGAMESSASSDAGTPRPISPSNESDSELDIDCFVEPNWAVIQEELFGWFVDFFEKYLDPDSLLLLVGERHPSPSDSSGQDLAAPTPTPTPDALLASILVVPSSTLWKDMEDEVRSTEVDIMDTTEADERVNGKGHSDAEDAGGLFGSGSEDEGGNHTKRKLDDMELDSGDDEGRDDRMEDAPEDDGAEEMDVQQSVNVADTSFGRHALPCSENGEAFILRYPHFAGVVPGEFKAETFTVPTTDHHSQGPASTTFSPAETSNSSVRWRRSPNDPRQLQSNSRIIEWEDGSFTLQFASNPTVQYLLPERPLAPPAGSHYDANQESHTYLASIHQASSFAQITSHVTKSLTVQTTNDQNDDDDATLRLQQSMAAATKGNKNAPDGKIEVTEITEDPELAKKRAEVAEREKLRAQRRRQTQEERERDRANRVLGRSGLRHGGTGPGLTVGGLEDDEGLTPAKPRAKPVRKPRRKNSEYSDDESDFRNRGRTHEDEYDEDDGFLVGSDEEPEADAEESEEEEEMPEEEEREERRSKKKEPKAPKEDVTAGRVKSRRVVDDEDDE